MQYLIDGSSRKACGTTRHIQLESSPGSIEIYIPEINGNMVRLFDKAIWLIDMLSDDCTCPPVPFDLEGGATSRFWRVLIK